MRKGFVSTMRKGFQMTFENGLTASVQWGAGNYCENYFSADCGFSKDAESNTAEIAVFDNQRKFFNPQDFFTYEISNDGEVAGHVTPSEVVDFLVAVRDYPNNK